MLFCVLTSGFEADSLFIRWKISPQLHIFKTGASDSQRSDFLLKILTSIDTIKHVPAYTVLVLTLANH